MSILSQLTTARHESKRLLAVLLDPDKLSVNDIPSYLGRVATLSPTHLLVGGSTVRTSATDDLVTALKTQTSLPIILFPGSYDQLSDKADALLFLSLLSGNNPEYLIGQHIKAAPLLRSARFEIIPTAYLLLDGGHESAVARISKTNPISQTNIGLILDTAYAAQLLGFRAIYLEAGSGANTPVSDEIIKRVASEIPLPIIVGGGIKSQAQIENAFRSGATMVVIGTAIEENSFLT